MDDNQMNLNEGFDETAVKQDGFVMRMVKAIVNPTDLFVQLKEKPDFWKLLLVMGIGTALAYIPNMGLFRDLIYEQFLAAPQKIQITDELINAGVSGMIAVAVVMATLIPLIKGFLVHLLGMLFNSKGNIKNTISVLTYATIPSFIGGILNLSIMGITKNPGIQLSLVRLLEPERAMTAPFVYKLAALVNPFTIWYYVLAVIGVSYVQEVSKPKALIIVLVPTLIMLLL